MNDQRCVVYRILRYGIASTYYGISLNISGLGLNIYLTHFIYAAIEVPAKLMVYCCLNIVGRRKAKRPGLLQRHESSGGLSGSSDSDAGGRLDSSSSDHHLLRGLRVRPGGRCCCPRP
ncbi:hypothetical protein F7725_023639 [Dissostichus mawsoni]|uniref:Uncharacterized protein n=1 Tax=Dissostichus mawsoni TaxID=36200 RepID=A0A7J5XZZ5_DISMA|nr:hypothetical protein F7725_023639 [Dissostichus mawsoni]